MKFLASKYNLDLGLTYLSLAAVNIYPRYL